jgi:hypothetical protein
MFRPLKSVSTSFTVSHSSDGANLCHLLSRQPAQQTWVASKPKAPVHRDNAQQYNGANNCTYFKLASGINPINRFSGERIQPAPFFSDYTRGVDGFEQSSPFF